ncbi:PREDICTED: E3 ubiquitin-protein ligase arkadia-C-like isoform X2 [Tarenaya hassleriana]|nr:PREDICTED: E3 ubiquitin-protein ligase arkadia-C-like isoform X2 [Tarenaya hassleriana]XP_010542303.1 PREDICTED: E3 ubiquitin-protein ligase arkadia-C-like isoform X2 [Tarenaya hassleriana]
MGQRNMMVDLEMQQQSQGYVQPESCIFLGSVTSFAQPDIPGVITASGNVPNLEAHPYDNALFYGNPHYHGGQHLHHHASSLDVGISTAPNLYHPYVTFHHPPSQLPSSSSHGDVGATSDEYERNAHLMDPTRGSYKRKNVQGTHGNTQYLSTIPAPRSLSPLNATTEPATFSLPQFRGAGSNSQLGQRRERNRPGAVMIDPVLSHGQNNVIQGNYAGQPLPLPGSTWFNQHQTSNGRSDGWTHSLPVPYMPGSSVVSGSTESGNLCLPRYHESSSEYPSPLNPSHHHYFSHHLSPPHIQGVVRSHNSTVYPPMAFASYGVRANYDPRSNMHDASEIGSTHVGPILRHGGTPHLRIMPADEVALLEVEDFYGTGDYADHHRDMRLDIEDMSYEELLALSERIGSVNTGLPEEKVHRNMKTRTYLLSRINLEEAPPADLETGSCTICQENFNNQEKIGTLDCGHDYHAECLKKWLCIKNVCPICKSEAIAM